MFLSDVYYLDKSLPLLALSSMTTYPESDEDIVSPKQRLSLGSLGFPKRGHRPLSRNHAGTGTVDEQGDADQSTSPSQDYSEPTVEKGRGQNLAREKFIGTDSPMGNISYVSLLSIA
jgi:hypothetical protein